MLLSEANPTKAHYDRSTEDVLKLDSTSANTDLHWLPRLTLDQALELTIEWYKGFQEGRDLRTLATNQITFYQNQCR